MRAMVLRSPKKAARGPLTGEERPPPKPAAGELLLRVNACAVCRTDLQICEGDLKARRLPIVPGHQAVGVVEGLGSGVSDWKTGDRAGVAWLASTCGVCSHCSAGRENLCEQAQFTGWDRDGGFAGMMTVRADFALRLPPAFPDLDAAPLLCGGIIGYRSLKRSGIRPGGRLGLYGFGASALLTLQVAKHWQCEVFVCGRSPAERDRALRLGADWSGGYDERLPVVLDAAITFAPAGSVVVAALQALDRGGTVAVNAIHLDRVPEFPYELLWWERNLVSVANFTRTDAAEFLELASAIPIKTETEVFPLEAANDALLSLAEGRISGAAVLRI